MTVEQGRVDRDTPLGATMLADGVGFRTWAPRACRVALALGAVDDRWQPGETDRLAPLGDGSWGGFVAGIGEGASYMFHVEGEGSSGLKRDPYARELSPAPGLAGGLCLVRDPTTYPWHDRGWRPPAFSELVIYQLHVGTWWAEDAQGRDARGEVGGTFLDVVARLDHLRTLGVNAIQLLPVQEFETPFSLGYNGVDYFAPERDYLVPPEALGWRLAAVNAALARHGQAPLTAADLAPGINQLKCLIDLCHLDGIAVIFDLVYNHAGGGFDPHSLWFYDRRPEGDVNDSLYFTDQGWAGGQIFAYWNDWVTRFLIDNARFFLREYRIDGIRYDEVRVIENSGGAATCRGLTAGVRATNPAAIQIAEYWNPDRAAAIRSLGFDAELGDRLRDALRGLLGQLAGGANAAVDLSEVAAGLAVAFDVGGPEAWRSVQALENQDLTYAGHDGAARVAALADRDAPLSWYARSRARAVTALLLCAPGIPSLFMGEEFLEAGNWSDDRGMHDLIAWRDLDDQDTTKRDFLRCAGDLVALRRSQPALRADGVRVARAEDRILVLHRWVPGIGADIVVVASFAEGNRSDQRIGLPVAGAWHELFNSDFYDGFPNRTVAGNGGAVQADGPACDGFAASAYLVLPANGVIVLGR